MQTCVCSPIGCQPKEVRRVRGLGLELAQPPSSAWAVPILERRELREWKVMQAAAAHPAIFLDESAQEVAKNAKKVWEARCWRVIRAGRGEEVAVLPRGRRAILLGTSGRAPSDDCGLVIGDFLPERRPA